MYIPQKFSESRVDQLHALMRAHPLATLVVAGSEGILANHVPLECSSEPAPYGTLRGHVARANPLWTQCVGEALAIFQGPQVYISPSLYPSKQQTGEVVPTWNYAVAHARGELRFVHDAGWLRDLVGRLTDAHEADRRAPWKVDDAPSAYTAQMLGMIVGFEMRIASLTGKYKLSQNRSAEDRAGVAQGLQEAGGPDAQEIQDLLNE